MKNRFLIPLLVLSALTAEGNTVTVGFPKDKPVFTMEIPKAFAVDATAERVIIKTRKEHKTFFHLAAIPAEEGVTDEATASAWLPKKARAVLNTFGGTDKSPFSEVREFFPNIAGHKALEIKHDGGDPGELEMWVFTPDGKRYFYAYFQEKTEDYEEGFKDAEADIGRFWPRKLLTSVSPK
jgi:hypothetical protein